MIYHQGYFAPDGRREYDIAAALLDFSDDDPVRARIEPLLRPEGKLEQAGDPDLGVDNVLFIRTGSDMPATHLAETSPV